ncbi:MAG: hypothetical protein VW684_15860 [Betaproteobacteria bacterium]
MMQIRSVLLILLSILMLLTRGSHFSGINTLPEASWMIFMVAGVSLPAWSFTWFMSLAVGIDAYAFTFGGVPGTCFSIAYGMLIPAYFSMWIAGRLAKPYFTGKLSGFTVFFGFVMAGTFICELISSGSFYLWSGNFEPTFPEFVARELTYAPAVFSSSAYWAVAFIVGTAVYRIYQQAKAPNVLTH